VEPLTRGLPPTDPRFLCPPSSIEFVEPPHRKKFLGTPLLVLNDIAGASATWPSVLDFTGHYTPRGGGFIIQRAGKKAVRRQSKNMWHLFCDRFLKGPLLTISRSFMNVANRVLWRMARILKANKVNLFVSCFVCFLVPFTEHFRHTTYIELLVKPENLTSYRYGPTFGNAEIRLFLFDTQCFNTESMQKSYPNYRWDLIRYVKG
jgi:hypothetical protein